jgi:hypothetical protein
MTVGRLVWLPVYEDEGRKLLHLGISGRTLEPRRQFLNYVRKRPPASVRRPDRRVRFRSRGSASATAPLARSTRSTPTPACCTATWQNMIGLEFVGNNGPWSFQSEYFGSWLYNARTTSAGPYVTNGYQPPPGTNVGTVYYQSGYAEVLYFLTGESRTYSKIEYRFDRPIPHNNFYAIRGGGSGRRLSLSEGAWQVGMRYNYLCLNDSGVNGGVLNGCTLGLNWLLNPNARVYFQLRFHPSRLHEHAVEQNRRRPCDQLRRERLDSRIRHPPRVRLLKHPRRCTEAHSHARSGTLCETRARSWRGLVGPADSRRLWRRSCPCRPPGMHWPLLCAGLQGHLGREEGQENRLLAQVRLRLRARPRRRGTHRLPSAAAMRRRAAT